MIKKGLLIALLIMIAGCSSNSSPLIEKMDTVQSETQKDPALIEQEKEKEIEQFIEFTLEDEQVLLNLQMVPILNEYLKGVRNHELAINEMLLERLPLEDHQIYLLEFSCFNNLCSYLLFNQSGENPAYLIADLAKLKNVLISTDQSKVALQFGRENVANIEMDHIVAVDLANWSILSLKNETGDDTILGYTWPYIQAEWIDDNSLSIRTPDVLEPTSKHLTEWKKSTDPTVTNTTLTASNQRKEIQE